MAKDHTAELVDALERARPNLTPGEYEAKRRELDRMIAAGDQMELTAGERFGRLALLVLGVVGLVAFPWGIGVAGGGSLVVGWLLGLVWLGLCIAGARRIGRP